MVNLEKRKKGQDARGGSFEGSGSQEKRLPESSSTSKRGFPGLVKTGDPSNPLEDVRARRGKGAVMSWKKRQ